jgi:hypothetical protein
LLQDISSQRVWLQVPPRAGSPATPQAWRRAYREVFTACRRKPDPLRYTLLVLNRIETESNNVAMTG